jgi:hypothetical protein
MVWGQPEFACPIGELVLVVRRLLQGGHRVDRLRSLLAP